MDVDARFNSLPRGPAGGPVPDEPAMVALAWVPLPALLDDAERGRPRTAMAHDFSRTMIRTLAGLGAFRGPIPAAAGGFGGLNRMRGGGAEGRDGAEVAGQRVAGAAGKARLKFEAAPVLRRWSAAENGRSPVAVTGPSGHRHHHPRADALVPTLCLASVPASYLSPPSPLEFWDYLHLHKSFAPSSLTLSPPPRLLFIPNRSLPHSRSKSLNRSLFRPPSILPTIPPCHSPFCSLALARSP